VTRRAFAARHEGGESGAVAIAAGLPPTGLKQGNHPRKRLRLGLLGLARPETKKPFPSAVQERVARFDRQILPGCLGVEWQLLGELLEDGAVPDDEVPSADAPGLDGTFAHGLLGLGHDQVLAERHLPAEPAAGLAGPLGVVEGKMPRRERVEHVATNGAAQALAQVELAPRRLRDLLRKHDDPVLPLAESQLERVGQPAALFSRDL
jgi:hypothetical protein